MPITKVPPGDTFKEVALEFIEKCRRDHDQEGVALAYPALGSMLAFPGCA